jgi:hypothetical protein
MTELVFVRRLPVCVVARAQWYVEAGVESITFGPGSFGSDIAGAVLTRLDQRTRLWGPHRRANLSILRTCSAKASMGWVQAEAGMADEGRGLAGQARAR